ncbi:PHP domain-containing protein [Fuchsiella alkaliacetigena]|uniref:PHP domain-containing protein n=1 Tax=Fuchsiella alkaliacetigena TaxID=957042 RepID=UPI00200B9741|nr:PHP domain-containing protein [Fuchsiella alkaliacetigena]MCK8824469.1 PHP domain-containing protein [Fuchsiella alkaliacetigena]
MLENSKVPALFKKSLPFFKSSLPSKAWSYLDFHLHTDDTDGLITTDFLKGFLKNKPHLISITDHNSINSCLELYSTPGLNIIPGIEVGCRDGFEFLIYFEKIEDLEKFYINSVEPVKHSYKIARTNAAYPYFLKEARKYDSFIVIPHIAGVAQKNYLQNKDYIHQVTAQVDGIETYNHSIPRSRNRKAKRVREIRGKFATFGSDAHIEQEVISFYKFQNSSFSKLAYFKKNIFNICAVLLLFGKHLHLY